MPERASPSWQRWFSRKGRSTTGRENLKGKNCPAVQSGAVDRSVVSAASKDATQTSTTTIDVSRPPTRLEPISPPRKAPAAASAFSSPPLAAQVTTFGDVTTSTDAYRTASPPERLWDRAYDDLKREETALLHAYEKILSCNLHEDDFGSAANKSQPNAIVQYDPDTRRRQMEQLVRTGLDKTAREAKVKGLGPTMDIVLSATNTISSAIQAMPQAALAWTGVCIALKETKANRDGVVHVIEWMNWYWNLSSSLLKESTSDADELSRMRHGLENKIVDLYKVLLTYQIKSVCSYYRHRGLVFLQDIVKSDDWDGDLKAIIDAEDRFRQYSKAYTTQHTNSHLEQLVTNQRSEKDQQCLKDLRVTDPRHDKIRIEQTKGGLLRDSYRWILDNSKLRKWRDDPENALLWIKADPGKGKTMLLCGIIDELNKSTPPDLLSFFFCQGTDSRINNATAVLRGLIYLLADQQPSLASYLRKKYDQAGKSLFEDANSWVALSDIFKNMLQDTNLKTTYLVIDALDECVTDLPKLLDFIVYTSSPSARIKWLLSSRNELHIEQKLKTADEQTRLSLELKENVEQVSRAVDAYIGDKLSHLESLHDNGLRDRVRDILHRKANGTFLWVALVIQELEKPESWDPLRVVEDVPTGLYQLYDRMVNQIQHLTKRNSEVCRLILSIATVAYRPLYLAEMGSLCGLPGQISALTENVRKIVSMCGSFLTIRDGQVYLIHQSAKDYLSDVARAKIFPPRRKTHYDIFSRSLELMSGTLQRDVYRLTMPGIPIDQVKVPGRDPLGKTRYSCVHWVDHLCDSISGKSMRWDDSLQDGGAVYVFLKKQYLYWLEALSLCKGMSGGVVSMANLEALIQERADKSTLIELVRDARRFIMYYKWTIENSPLQAYASALVFSPARSLIRGIFKEEEPKCITIKPAIRDKWSACLQTLEGHSDSVTSVTFSHDSAWLASGSGDRTVKIWNASSGECLQTLEGHSSSVSSVTFSHDSARLASGSESFDNTVKIWDASSGECLQTLKGHGSTVSSVTFSHNSARLASGSYDNTVKIWDASNG
ncbi:hypothetical protein GP486_006481, partial [Trichoglossum hirsutum]